MDLENAIKLEINHYITQSTLRMFFQVCAHVEWTPTVRHPCVFDSITGKLHYI